MKNVIVRRNGEYLEGELLQVYWSEWSGIYIARVRIDEDLVLVLNEKYVYYKGGER